jgi:hypothetical protein
MGGAILHDFKIGEKGKRKNRGRGEGGKGE